MQNNQNNINNNFNNLTQLTEPFNLNTEDSIFYNKIFEKISNNTLKKIDESMEKAKEKTKNLKEQFPDNVTFLLKKNKKKNDVIFNFLLYNEETKEENYNISASTYYKNGVKRLETFLLKIESLIYVWKKWNKIKDGKINYNEKSEINKKLLDVCYNVNLLINRFINFFNKIKEITSKKQNQIYANDFEEMLSKELRSLYDDYINLVKKMVEFKIPFPWENENVKRLKKITKNKISEKTKKEFISLLKVLTDEKDKLKKFYDSLDEVFKETEKFNKDNVNELLKEADSILEKESYIFKHLLKGNYTDNKNAELNMLDLKITLCASKIQNVIEYLKIKSMLFNNRKFKVIYESEENIKQKNLNKEETNVISDCETENINEEINTKNTMPIIHLQDNPPFSSYDSSDKSDYSNENKNIFIRKKRSHPNFEESYYNKILLKPVHDFLNFPDIQNPEGNENFDQKDLEDIYYYKNEIEDRINVIRNIYENYAKKETKISIGDLLKNSKDEINKNINLDENAKKAELKDVENIISNNKYDKLEAVTPKGFILDNMEHKRLLYHKNVIADLIKKFFKEFEIEIANDIPGEIKNCFSIINMTNANSLMKDYNLYKKRSYGFLHKIADIDNFMYANGITKSDLELFKKSEFYNPEIIKNIKYLVYMAETKQLSLKKIKKLVKLMDNYKEIILDLKSLREWGFIKSTGEFNNVEDSDDEDALEEASNTFRQMKDKFKKIKKDVKNLMKKIKTNNIKL